MLFFCVGSIYDRYHTREIAEIGGGMIAEDPAPRPAIFAFVAIASLGLPGLAGFWGEVMALLSSFNPAAGLSIGLFRSFMVAGGIGTILTAGYFLWMLQRVNMGDAAGQVEGDRLPRHPRAWSGSRGCRCSSASWCSACSRGSSSA